MTSSATKRGGSTGRTGGSNTSDRTSGDPGSAEDQEGEALDRSAESDEDGDESDEDGDESDEDGDESDEDGDESDEEREGNDDEGEPGDDEGAASRSAGQRPEGEDSRGGSPDNRGGASQGSPEKGRAGGPAAAASPVRSAQGAGKSVVRRFFWMEDELAAARASAFSPQMPGYAEFELARQAWSGAETLGEFPDRQTGQLLLLIDTLSLAAAAQVKRTAPEAGGEDLSVVWSRFEALPQIRAQLAKRSAAEQAFLREAVAGNPRRELARLSRTETEARIQAVTSLVDPLIAELEDRADAASGIKVKRALRIGVAVVLLLGLVIAAIAGAASQTRGPNLAFGKPVSTSSDYDTRRFPAQGLTDGNLDAIGCHTKQQQNPWVRIDLGEGHTVREVVVTNRLDRFRERAVPLVVEVSTDGQTWQEFSRRDEVFSTWTSQGRTSGRYVRLLVQNTTELHLNEVEVY